MAPKLSSRGLTIIELMIVVAVIGALAAIAVPNYQKFQNDSRTITAKTFLSSSYITQWAFFAENGTFTGCLAATGILRPAIGRRFYTMGFHQSVVTTNTTCGSQGHLSCAIEDYTITPMQLCVPPYIDNKYNFQADNAVTGVPVPEGQLNVPGGMTAVSRNAYIIGAAGRINSMNNNIDKWTINEARVILHTQDGTN